MKVAYTSDPQSIGSLEKVMKGVVSELQGCPYIGKTKLVWFFLIFEFSSFSTFSFFYSIKGAVKKSRGVGYVKLKFIGSTLKGLK